MKRWLSILLFLVLCVNLSACRQGADDEEKQETVQIYYINREETVIRPVEYMPAEEEREALVAELITIMREEPDDEELKSTIFPGIDIYKCTLLGEKLIIDFSQTYKDMSPTTEVLVRAAIVRTMCQIDGVKTIEFQVEGETLIDHADIVVGDMRAEQFIDNEGTEINTYEVATLKLYFANEDGTALVPVTRKVEYNTNIALEKLVMEQLIGGPGTLDAKPTMNPATKIINVTVNDKVCYVNLSQEFLTQVYTVNSEVTIYSIVNSLVELDNVNKVQILVDGKSEISYRESMSLSNPFSRNLDLVE